jgi:hypothetical protein
MKRRVRCFHEDFEKTKPYTVMDAGIRVIEVKQVVGTVDKCGELDDSFRYIKRRDNAERSRRYRLEQAAKRYQFFPPIDVYLLPSFYPALTEGDIFVLIVRFYREFMGGVPTEDFHVLISGFMFAHTIPERRIWRKYPFRLIGKLITHREEKPIFPRD